MIDDVDNFDPWDDPYANAQPTPAAPVDRGWRWTLRTPQQAPREGYYWGWQGGWDEGGQGWQEMPIAGWDSPNGQRLVDQFPATGGPNEAPMGLGYWAQRGYDENDIFDLNTGQLKPGWSHTAQGYAYAGAPTYGSGGSVGSGGGYGGGGGYQAPERRPLAALNYPSFNAPTFAAPAPFSYENFQIPTIEEAQSEPGFDYALKEGLKAFENSKAYLGTYRSGGTIKGLNDYARNMATQNYDKVFDRKAQTYDRNRANAADAYATNYGISRDVFDRNYTSAKDTYAPQARAAELQFARDWDVYAYEGDDDYRRWKALVDANS
jgi:hypothetical protein